MSRDESPVRLLYVTPERLTAPGFQRMLTSLFERELLDRIAVDECHVIYAWGHGFRPDYNKYVAVWV